MTIEQTELSNADKQQLAELAERTGTDEEAHRILAKVSGSIVDVLNEDRGER
jgi:hypothetical protein